MTLFPEITVFQDYRALKCEMIKKCLFVPILALKHDFLLSKALQLEFKEEKRSHDTYRPPPGPRPRPVLLEA